MDKQQILTAPARVADLAAPVGWAAWIVSHIQEINSALQTVLLVVSIFATIAAGLYHLKKWRRMK